jgi:hypothetical protein
MSEKTKTIWCLDGSHHATIVGRENVDSGKFVILGHEKLMINLFIQAKAQLIMPREVPSKLFKTSTAHMQNVDELHVTGTGTAQRTVINYLKDTPQYKVD